MVWVFGIVFLVFVAISAIWLYRNSARNKALLESFSRKRRITIGVSLCVGSFAMALCALGSVSAVANWNSPPPLPLFGVLVFMMLFVVSQVASMLCFVSLAAQEETGEDAKRS